MQNIQAMDMKRFVTILCVMILFVPSAVFSEDSTGSTPTALSASTADSSTHAVINEHSETTQQAVITEHSETTQQAVITEHSETTQSFEELQLGENCAGDKKTLCVNGTTCDKDICKISIGGNCTVYRDNCTSGTVCEDNICKLNVGESCGVNNATYCRTGTSCDNNFCKLNVGESCAGNNASYCKNGTSCDNNFCKLQLGENCAGDNQTLCVNGTTCDKDICKISVGGNCTEYRDNCTSGTVCEENICKLQLGENCAGDNQTLCVNGTTCDKDICKISIGGNCTGYRDNCTSGTVCEDNICRLVYGSNCSTFIDHCISSLKCTSIKNNEALCLCPDKQFGYNNFCQNVTSVIVHFTQDNNTYEENEISVQWTPPNFPQLDITYLVNTSDGLIEDFANESFAYFSKGVEGTMYLITITTKVKKDQFLSNLSVEAVSASQQYYTRPATPGNLTYFEYAGPDVHLQFNHSKGRVEQYFVSVLSQIYTVNATRDSNPSVVIKGLAEGNSYNVTIYARITRNDTNQFIDSANLTTMFIVQANKSDPVSNLTMTRNSSRWLEVSWLKPAKPKGEIIGYTLYAKRDGGNCILSVVVQCTDCSRINATEKCDRTEPKNYTMDQLQNATFEFKVNVTDLKPAVSYTMTVFAHNEVGEGERMDLTVTTDEEAAQDISFLSISAPNEKMLNITWTPGECTGVTTYCVTWAEETSLGSNNYSQLKNANISGYENVSLTINGLLSFWNYNVTVQAFTAKGFSPTAKSASYKTKDSQPGEVKDFQINQPEKSAQKLDLIIQCPKERDRNGNITWYSVTYSIIGTENYSHTVNTTSDPDCSNIVSISIDVTAEMNYSIGVSANTERYIGVSTNKTQYIYPKEPNMTQATDGLPGFVFFANAGKTDTSVTVGVCNCLFEPKQGEIILAGIIICKKSETTSKDCEPAQSKTEAFYRASNLTWAHHIQASTPRYRTTPDNFHKTLQSSARRRKRSFSGPRDSNYTIGSNSSCIPTDNSTFCNGKLTPQTRYIVTAFACTRGGCSESSTVEIETSKSPSPGSDVGAIVGGIFGALAAIAIIVLVIFLYRRYQRKDDFVEIDAPHKTIVRKPVKLKHFAEHLERLHRDSNLLFQEEFEEVQENSPKHYSTDAATLDANKVKNRYVNILSFDHTRVKLITDDGDPSTDFINANYIPGYSSPREYIATQGPMVSTVADLWRMMWEQNSSIIVMLSDLTEKGRPKVDMYWPNELNSPVQYGNVIVDMTACSTLNTYTIRNFTISMENGNEKRRVTQYFFPGLEDYGANVSPEDFLDFVKAVRREATSKPGQGPITVHCSAGVGHTGMFIALDFLMQFVNDNSLDEEVDIYNLVLNTRHHRPMMVQSEKQYIFVHDALKLIIENKIKAMKEQNDDNIYQNTTTDNIYANQAFELEDENLYENTSKHGQHTTIV